MASGKVMRWIGRVLSGVVVALLLVSGTMKIVGPPELMEEFTRLGYGASLSAGIGILEIVCALVYAIPQTTVLGAILLTGYFGGATATHVRIGDPFIGPVAIGVVAWIALFMREERLRKLIPVRTKS